MFCDRCGKEAKSQHSFCTGCGARLGEQSSGQSEGTDGRSDNRQHRQTGGDQPRPDERRTSTVQNNTQTTERSARSVELATSAFGGYLGIVVIRLTGVSGLLFEPRGANPLLGGPLHEAGVFLFYDGFVLAIAGACASGYVAARGHLGSANSQTGRETLDRLASIGLPVVSLLYLLGLLLSVAA